MIWYFGFWFLSVSLPLASRKDGQQKLQVSTAGWEGGKRGDKPAGIDGLAGGAADEFLHGDGADVLQVVGAGVRDDAVPDDGLVCGVG